MSMERPSTGGPEDVETLNSLVSEYRDKLARWKEQSKVGIEQHRKRIIDLTAKLRASLDERQALKTANASMVEFLIQRNTLVFDALTTHSITTASSSSSSMRSWANRMTAIRDELQQEMSQTKSRETVQLQSLFEALKKRFDISEQEVRKLTAQKMHLEEKLKHSSSQESLKESAATRDAVALAVNAARESFDAEELALRIQYENEISELRLLHEVEMNRLNDESEHRVETLRQEMELKGQTHFLESSRGAEPLSEVDDSYSMLLQANKTLDEQVASLKKDNAVLLDEISSLHRRPPEIAGKKQNLLGDSVLPHMPSTMTEAQTMLVEARGREKNLLSEIGDLKLQLGALKERPPLPVGALGAEQVRYLKALVLKLYTASNRDHMMSSLAPAIGMVLDLTPEEVASAIR